VSDHATFVAGLPKAELHVHHVGSASPRTVAELASRYEGSTPVPADEALLADYFTFTDFRHFVDVYLSVVDLIRDVDDIWTLTYEVARDLAAQSVRYAELTLTPYSSVVRGIPSAAYCEAVEDARHRAEADFGLTLRWCFDIPGEAGVPAADLTLDVALTNHPDGLVSFGLGGPEAGVPRERFASHFARARAAGLHSVPHAGESTGSASTGSASTGSASTGSASTGPASIWAAIRHLGAERIGHGIAAVHDPMLLAYLAAHRIPLEVCPTSNVRTRSVPSLAEHPLPVLVAAGVPVSINSDDPPMFSTTLCNEYLVAAGLLGLDKAGLADLAKAAVHASFLDAAGKSGLLGEIDAYAESTGLSSGR
jgi:adenosine deaminase